MDHDGTKAGFAIAITEQVTSAVSIPVIASGGGGTIAHFKDIFEKGKADAALAASIFHFKEIEIVTLKTTLSKQQIPMRIL
jgi:cyclase